MGVGDVFMENFKDACRMVAFNQADTEGDVEKPHDLSSDVVWTNYFLKTDPALNEYLQVKEFLEGTAPDFIPIEVRKGYLYHTVKSVRQAQVSKRGNEKAELDPGCTDENRQAYRGLTTRIMRKVLNRSLFEYVRPRSS
ncbi:hypothetical protein BC829DRAFT_199052 [Chytridium lagenaria]|nr:hypothetical protein BC829DRAFT_199052 [Chytridium lagenaria]